ncbi:hypothetical protein HDU86_003699 [Geranomyces michiganensis]|nr:hypothetical protein HDU86_003699 [Geranomyces michiganensis]
MEVKDLTCLISLQRPTILKAALAGLESVFLAPAVLDDATDINLLQQLVQLLIAGRLPNHLEPPIAHVCRILKTLARCLDNPRAAEFFIISSSASADSQMETDGISATSLFSSHIQPLIHVNQSNKALHVLQAITTRVAMFQGCAALQQLSMKRQINALDVGSWQACLRRLYTIALSERGRLSKADSSRAPSPFVSTYLEKWQVFDSIGKILDNPSTACAYAVTVAIARLMGFLLTTAETVMWLFPTTGSEIQPLAWLHSWCANFGIDLVLFISQLGFPTDWPSQSIGVRDLASTGDADGYAAFRPSVKDIVCLTALQFKAVLTVRRLTAVLERFNIRGSLASIPRQLLRSLLTMTGTISGQQAVAVALETCGGSLPLLRFCMPALRLPELASTQGDLDMAAEILLVILKTSASLSMLQEVAREALSISSDDVPPALECVLDPLLSHRKAGLARILVNLNRDSLTTLSDSNDIARVSVTVRLLIEACEKDLASVLSFVDDHENVTSHGTLAEINVLRTDIELLDRSVRALAHANDILYGDLLNETTTEKAILDGGGVSAQPIIVATERKLALYGVVELCMKLLRHIIVAYDIARYPRKHNTHTQIPYVIITEIAGVSGQAVPSLLHAEDAAARREPRSQGITHAGTRPSGPLFAIPDVVIKVLHVLGAGIGTAGHGCEWKCNPHAANALRDALEIMRDLVRYEEIASSSRDTGPEMLVGRGKTDAGCAVLTPRFMLPLGSVLRALFESISYDSPQFLITGLSLLSDLLPAPKTAEDGASVSPAIAIGAQDVETSSLPRDAVREKRYWQDGLRPLRGEVFRILRIVLATSSSALYEAASQCFSRLIQVDATDANGNPGELARSIVGILIEEVKRCYKDDTLSGKSVSACDGPRATQRLRFLNDVSGSEAGGRALLALRSERQDISGVFASLSNAFDDQADIQELCASLGKKLEVTMPSVEIERSSAETEERKGKRTFAEAAPGGAVSQEVDDHASADDVQVEAAHRAKRIRFDQMATDASEAALVATLARPAPAPLNGLQALISGFDFGASLPPNEIPTPRQLARYLDSSGANEVGEMAGMTAASLSLPSPGGSASAVTAFSVTGAVAATTAAPGVESSPSMQAAVSYRQYTKDEFRTAHHTKRKMNASRPPSVHVDKFGRLPPPQQQQLMQLGGSMPRLSSLPQPPALDYDPAAMAAAAAAAAHRPMFMQGPPHMLHPRVGGPAAAAAAAAAASLFPPPQLPGREWEQAWDPSTLPPGAGSGTGAWAYPPGFYPGWWGA